MRRLESDPDEQREIDDALGRAATPMHEQDTIEFDSREVIEGLHMVTEPDSGRSIFVDRSLLDEAL